jgi:hypothetical protein
MSGGIVMSFYWGMAVLEAESMCRPGEWKPITSVSTASMPCMPCPVGMKCISGNAVHCPVGTVSLEKGASQCCHRNMTCPHGNAVSSTDCKCMQITCPHQIMKVRHDMQCVDTCDTECKTVDKDCKCSTAAVCDGGTWWRVGEKYACLWLQTAAKK